MKKVILFAVLCFFSELLCAQNLVLNPSFEDAIECPNSLGEISKAKYWSSFSQSPDYYNKCSKDTFQGKTFVSVPVNYQGYQDAFQGNAYCGLISYYPMVKGYREIIGGTLTTPLVPGIKYYMSMKVSLAEVSSIITNKLGISFSTVQYHEYLNLAPINNRAAIYSYTIISDTSEWVTISGSFKSDSAYKYVMIGNFFNDDNTDTINLSNITQTIFDEAYYYIDCVCVSDNSLQCNFVTGLKSISPTPFNISPNPANEKIHIYSNLKYSYSLFSILGADIHSSEASGNSVIDISALPSGLYILQIQYINSIHQQKLIINHN